MAGIKYSSTWQISRDGRTARITWKLCEYRFTLIVEYEGCTFRTDFTEKMSYQRNSNYSCLYRTKLNVDCSRFFWAIFRAFTYTQNICFTTPFLEQTTSNRVKMFSSNKSIVMFHSISRFILIHK